MPAFDQENILDLVACTVDKKYSYLYWILNKEKCQGTFINFCLPKTKETIIKTCKERTIDCTRTKMQNCRCLHMFKGFSLLFLAICTISDKL
jgi:hypothetical protein